MITEKEKKKIKGNLARYRDCYDAAGGEAAGGEERRGGEKK